MKVISLHKLLQFFWRELLFIKIFFFFCPSDFFFFFLQCTWPQLADSTVIMARARSEGDFSLGFRPLATDAATAEAGGALFTFWGLFKRT